MLKRYSGAIISLLFGVGLEVSPIESMPLAIVLWSIAGVWAIVATIPLIRNRKKPKSKPAVYVPKSEMAHVVEERQKYLPKLKQTLIDYVSRVEGITNVSEELVDLEVYREYYKPRPFKILFKKYTEEQSLVVELAKRKAYIDNLVLREIESTDEILGKLSIKLDEYKTQVKDKQVYNAIRGIKEATHIAYSYVVYNKLWCYYFSAIDFETKFHFKTERKMIDKLRELQNGTNKRIDELLEGAVDEPIDNT